MLDYAPQQPASLAFEETLPLRFGDLQLLTYCFAGQAERSWATTASSIRAARTDLVGHESTLFGAPSCRRNSGSAARVWPCRWRPLAARKFDRTAAQQAGHSGSCEPGRSPRAGVRESLH